MEMSHEFDPLIQTCHSVLNQSHYSYEHAYSSKLDNHYDLLALPSGLTSPRQALAHFYAIHDAHIASGRYVPFVYPWATLGALVVIAYLMIDHRRSPFLRACRYPVFAFVCASALWCIAFTRARNPSGGLAVGFISSLSVLWVARLLLFNDCQTDFCRIERAPSKQASDAGQDSDRAKKTDDEHAAAFYWQRYPDGSLSHRLDWVLDMLCSFRGVGWNWQISGIPPPPPEIAAQLKIKGATPNEDAEGVSRSWYGISRYHNRTQLLKVSARELAYLYVTLDALKTVISHDPWFWGYADRLQSAPAWFPNILAERHTVIQAYHIAVAAWYVHSTLHAVFMLGPVFFCGILGPARIGVRGEAWMQPTTFGSLRAVLDQGLSGFWSIYWHQMFRSSFEAPGTRICQRLKIELRSCRGRLVALAVAFFLSGYIHACATHTQVGETRPLRGSMAFFMLQAVGIVLQTYLVEFCKSCGITLRVPLQLRRIANLSFVLIWMCYTGPLFADDLVSGGIWMQEPIPISPLRGLGFGAVDEGWWCWGGGIARWHSGRHWWDTGLEF